MKFKDKEGTMPIFNVEDWVNYRDGRWWKRYTWTHFPSTGWVGVSWFGALLARIEFRTTGKQWLINDYAEYVERQRAYKANEIETPNFNYANEHK